MAADAFAQKPRRIVVNDGQPLTLFLFGFFLAPFGFGLGSFLLFAVAPAVGFLPLFLLFSLLLFRLLLPRLRLLLCLLLDRKSVV